MQRMAEGDLAEHDFGVSADYHEEIVEVVSDAAGEAAYGFHFLGLAELVFENAAFGDVFGDGFEDVGGFIAGDGTAADADGNDSCVFALPANFKAVHASAAAEFVDQTGVFGGVDEDVFLRIEGQDIVSGVVTEHSDQSGVDVEKTAIEAGTVNSVDGGLHQGAVAEFGAAQGLLVALAVDGGG